MTVDEIHATYRPLIQEAKATVVKLEAEYEEALEAFRVACDHKNPDGTLADDGSMMHGFCTKCGEYLG